MSRARLFSLLVAAAFAACSKSEPSTPAEPPPAAPAAQTPSKDPATARKLIAEGAAVVDVRTADEYGAAHVPSATNIPVDELAARLAEIDKLVGGDKSKPVVVYCGTGRRAGKAKQQLEAAGYTQVVNGGGLDDLQ